MKLNTHFANERSRLRQQKPLIQNQSLSSKFVSAIKQRGTLPSRSPWFSGSNKKAKYAQASQKDAERPWGGPTINVRAGSTVDSTNLQDEPDPSVGTSAEVLQQAAQPKVSEGPADAASASALQGILPIAAGEPIPSAEAELPSVLPQAVVPVAATVDTAVQCNEQQAYIQMAAATQTDATGPQQREPPRRAQRTLSIQTDSNAASQLLLSQWGHSSLAKADFEMCQAIRGAVKKATRSAHKGHIKRAQQELFEVLDNHEEDLLFIFGNCTLKTYRMGSFVDVVSLVSSPRAALEQSQRLLQEVPGHFVGRLAHSISCHVLEHRPDASSMLQPMGLTPGPLGIASAVCDFMQVSDCTLSKVKVCLLEANQGFTQAVDAMSQAGGSAWRQLKTAQDQLQQQHEAAMRQIRGDPAREWCASLRAVGNIIAGRFCEAQEICREWVKGWQGAGYPLWAHMLISYCHLHMAEDDQQLQQVGSELWGVAKEARKATLVHLALDALPQMPSDSADYIKSIEATATAVRGLATDYSQLKGLMDDLELKWDQGTSAEMLAGIEEALAKSNALLDGKLQEAARGLSVRITARLYAMRAKIHIFKRDYLLADADSSLALSLDPYQAEVLAHKIRILMWAHAFKATALVVDMGRSAAECVARQGDRYVADKVARLTTLGQTQGLLQAERMRIGGQDFDSLLPQNGWLFFCNYQKRCGRQYVLRMSPDKVTNKIGDFGKHMGLKLAYVSQTVMVGSAEHYQILRHNVQEHAGASFGPAPVGHTPHADMEYLLGFTLQPRPFLPPPPGDADQASSGCHSSPQQEAGPGFHPTPTPEAHPASQPGSDDEGHSRPGSPEYQATSPRYVHRGSEDGSAHGPGEGIGCRPASPDYSPTSPRYSPRASSDSHDGYAVTSPVYRPSSPAGSQDSPPGSPVYIATSPGYAGNPSSSPPVDSHPSLAHRDSQPDPQQATATFTSRMQADTTRPGTSCGRRPPQQQGFRSGFSFDRRTEAAAQVPAAAAQVPAAASVPTGGDSDGVQLNNSQGAPQHVNHNPAEEAVTAMDWAPAPLDAGANNIHPKSTFAAAAAASSHTAAERHHPYASAAGAAAEADAFLSGLNANLSAQTGHESPLSSLESYSDPDDRDVQESAEALSADSGNKSSLFASASTNDPSATAFVWGAPQSSSEQVPASSFATPGHSSAFTWGASGEQVPASTSATPGHSSAFTWDASGNHFSASTFPSPSQASNFTWSSFQGGATQGQQPQFGGFSSDQPSAQQTPFTFFSSGQPSGQQQPFGGSFGKAPGQQSPFGGFSGGEASDNQPGVGDFTFGQKSKNNGHGFTSPRPAAFGTTHQPNSASPAAQQPFRHFTSGAEQSPSAKAGSHGAGFSFGEAPGRDYSAGFKFGSSGCAKEQSGSAATNGEYPAVPAFSCAGFAAGTKKPGGGAGPNQGSSFGAA